MPFRIFLFLCALAIASCSSTSALSEKAGGVQISQLADRLRVEIGGKLFTEYFYTNVPRPYCYPVLGPGDLPISRDWPMKDTAGEQHDHKHHRSLWYAHGDINGVDFWSEDKSFGKTVHEKFTAIQSGEKFGVIKSRNAWVTADGKIVCHDDRTLKVWNSSSPRLIDFEITFHATDGSVTFGDTKEGSMAIRLAETMRLSHEKRPGEGHIINSEGVTDGKTWGKRAKWVDYYGPVQGRTVGVAMFDHPSNPRHPTWWHVRDYGLFAANPFGQHDFEKQPPHSGDYTIPAGKSATFKYRLVLHEGDATAAQIATLYQKFIAE